MYISIIEKAKMKPIAAILGTVMSVRGAGAFSTTSHYFTRMHSHQDRASLASASFRKGQNSMRGKLGMSSTATTSTESDPTSHKELENIELEQKTWMFQNKYPIAYEVAKSTADNIDDDADELIQILFLNGFGVGSFHQHRLMRQFLLEQNNIMQKQKQSSKQKKYVLYGIDYLGQGKSWPADCNDGNSKDELNLGYSADMWLDQLKGFIEEVILPPSSSSSSSVKKGVHLVGNSVGGYLSTILTNRHPHLVSSLTLMNATPVWGLNLPGWDGKLPAPVFPKLVGRILFDTIRDMNVIDKYLDAAYVHREAFDGSFDDSFYGSEGGMGGCEALGTKIRGCTEGKGGHAAFASILWSAPASEWEGEGEDTSEETSLPKQPADYYAALGNLPVDVLLLFGSDDPWCTPSIAKRMHTTLYGGRVAAEEDGPAQRYIALENVGHCPNHEAPTAVAKVLLPWVGASSSASSQSGKEEDGCGKNRSSVPLIPSDGSEAIINEPWGPVGIREVSIEESQDLGIVDRIVSSMVG